MKMTLRWYGASDRVTLQHLRQIPTVQGIVSSLHDVAVGTPWRASDVIDLRDTIAEHDLAFSVVESIPVHEEIKLGTPARDRYIDAFCESVTSVGTAGVPVVCYNYMPVFDWMRTALELPHADGSTSLAYDHDELERIDLSRGTGGLPGWAAAYDAHALTALRSAWQRMEGEAVWDSLAYFLERVVPVATAANVKLAIHPDDPPWSIFGLPRIIVDAAALRRVLSLVDSLANGLTLCTGSLGARADNDLAAMAEEFGARGQIHFMHCRNVKRGTPKAFREVAHPSSYGDVDMCGVLAALKHNGFAGPMRPDHGRMIWGEKGRAGYGLFDRALGATYLSGLWEGIRE